MRIIIPLIIALALALIIPSELPAADADEGLFAALRSGQSTPDISPADILINEPEPLRGRFLVATPRLKGSFFSKTVILLLSHSDRGSSGLVINRPSYMHLSTVFPDTEEIRNIHDRIYNGGPVESSSFLILIKSDDKPPESYHLMGNLHMSASLETLKFMYKQAGTDKNIRVFFGYAGWGPDQLKSEVDRGSWHVLSGDTGLVFDNNIEELWERLTHGNVNESETKQRESEKYPRKPK